MHPKPPSCSLVIRAYNEQAHIGRLLDGVLQQSIKDVEIVLADSGSTDRTLEIVSRYPVKVVHIPPAEFTFGYSLNTGIHHSQAEFIVIASAHVYPVYPDWLESLLAPFTDPQVGLTYGKQRGGPENNFAEQQIFQHWYPDQSNLHQSIPFCNNANAAIRRSLWEDCPYDENLPGLEDLDWANRIMALNSGICYVAEAEVIHIHAETPRAVYNRYRREAMAFKRIFPHENYHLGNLVQHLSTNLLSDARQAARRHKLLSCLNEIMWFRWMQFWGTYQGYRQSGPLTWQLRQTFYYPSGRASAASASSRRVSPIEYSSEEGSITDER